MDQFLRSNDRRVIQLTDKGVVIASQDGLNTVVLLYRDLIWFVRELIDQIANPDRPLDNEPTGLEPRRHHYSREIRRAIRLLIDGGFDIEDISDARLDNMIAKGFANVLPEERKALTLAVEKVWLPKIDPARIDRLLQRAQAIARIKALNQPEDKPIAANGFARLLGLRSGAGNHVRLAEFCGDYLIFRRLSSAGTLVAAHLTIAQDPKARFPATFVTRTSVPENSGPRESVVRGVVYEPDDVPGILFATGKYARTKQLRTTILRPVRKLVDDHRNFDLDIEGIRLGISRIQRWPVAYKIWCSRVREEMDWQAIARAYQFCARTSTRLAPDPEFRQRYGLDPQEFFTARVHGFERIMDRLVKNAFLALDQNGFDDE